MAPIIGKAAIAYLPRNHVVGISKLARVLHDWNVEVASGARIPQPRCRRVSTGLVLNLRRLGDEVEVDGELAAITDEGRRTLALSQPIFTLV